MGSSKSARRRRKKVKAMTMEQRQAKRIRARENEALKNSLRIAPPWLECLEIVKSWRRT